MVFQNYALYPNKTVYKNLAFPLQMRKHAEGRDRPQGARGGARCSTSPTCSSAGRASSPAASSSASRSAGRWCATPRVFLMDEPLSNLDAKLRVQMRSEIKRFHHDLNATIVYVTHDQLEAVTMADKMAVMNGGLLQQYDAPDDVFAHPVNTFVAGFVGSPAMSLIPVEVASAEGRHGRSKAASGWELPLSPSATPARRARSTSGKVGARRAPLDAQAAQGRRRRARCPAGSTPSSRPATSPSPRSSSTARWSTSASRRPSRIAARREVWIEFDQDRMHLFDGDDAPRRSRRPDDSEPDEDHRHHALSRPGSASATSSSSRSRPTRASTAGARAASPAARRRSSARSSTTASS